MNGSRHCRAEILALRFQRAFDQKQSGIIEKLAPLPNGASLRLLASGFPFRAGPLLA
jgi:hypothetical protein